MAKFTPIMGIGSEVRELEHCPPAFHVELTPEELGQLIQDPGAGRARLGLDEGIRSIHILLPQPGDPVLRGDGPRMYCCIKCLTDSLC